MAARVNEQNCSNCSRYAKHVGTFHTKSRIAFLLKIGRIYNHMGLKAKRSSLTFCPAHLKIELSKERCLDLLVIGGLFLGVYRPDSSIVIIFFIISNFVSRRIFSRLT